MYNRQTKKSKKQKKHSKVLIFIAAAVIFNTLAYLMLTINGIEIIFSPTTALFTKKIVAGSVDSFEDTLIADLSKNSVISLSFEHGDEASESCCVEMIKYLHDECGYDYIATDLSYPAAVLLTKYLSNGDSELLDAVAGHLNLKTSEIRAFKEKLRELCEYNSTSLTDLTIIGCGTDYDECFKLYFELKRKEFEASGKNSDLIDELFAQCENDEISFSEFSIQISDFEQKYRSLFLEEYFDFVNIVDCGKHIEAQSLADDEYVYLLFNKMIDKYVKGKFVCVCRNDDIIREIRDNYKNTRRKVGLLSIYNDFNGLNSMLDEECLIVDNRFYKYLCAYRREIFRLNGERYSPIFILDDDVYISVKRIN